jgi:hypothetical protein
MPGTNRVSTSMRVRAPLSSIISAVTTVTGTGASRSGSSCLEAAVTFIFRRLTRSWMSAGGV